MVDRSGGLERFTGDALPVTDDRPRIEDAAWVRRGEFQRVLPRLLALSTDVPLPEGDPLQPAIRAQRQELFDFYRWSLHVMAGEREQARNAFREVLVPRSDQPVLSLDCVWQIGAASGGGACAARVTRPQADLSAVVVRHWGVVMLV